MTSWASATCFFAHARKSAGLNVWRRLRLGSVNDASHHNTGCVDIQGQFDLLVLRSRCGFACDWRSAGLSVRSSFVSIHVLVDVAT